MQSQLVSRGEKSFTKEQILFLMELEEEIIRQKELFSKQQLELETAKIYQEIAETNKNLELRIKDVDLKIVETTKNLEAKIVETTKNLEAKIAETNKNLELKIANVDLKIADLKTEVAKSQNKIIIWVISAMGIFATLIKALDFLAK